MADIDADMQALAALASLTLEFTSSDINTHITPSIARARYVVVAWDAIRAICQCRCDDSG